MALLNQKAFERKLQNMSSTQDSVQTVSLWMIHHKKHAMDMAKIWLDQLRKVKSDRRLTLFYLANDVLQNSRKKGTELNRAFNKVLREAASLLGDSKIRSNVERVLKIWMERKVFDADYLEGFRSKLGSASSSSRKTKEKPTEKQNPVQAEVNKPQTEKRLPPADFKPSKLINTLSALREFEAELTLKQSHLSSLRIDASDMEAVHQLKDRAGGAKFWDEHEEATVKLEEFCDTLRKEQEYRKKVTTVLEDGEAFYDVAHGEVKVIVHAYKSFGNRLNSLKKKLDHKVNKLIVEAAERAKTGCVSAPVESFLSSGLPDFGGTPSSTPPQTQEAQTTQTSDESKPADPTVDNTEVADMDIEEDSDSDTPSGSEEQSSKSSPEEVPTIVTSAPTSQTTPSPSTSTPAAPAVRPAQVIPPGFMVPVVLGAQPGVVPTQLSASPYMNIPSTFQILSQPFVHVTPGMAPPIVHLQAPGQVVSSGMLRQPGEQHPLTPPPHLRTSQLQPVTATQESSGMQGVAGGSVLTSGTSTVTTQAFPVSVVSAPNKATTSKLYSPTQTGNVSPQSEGSAPSPVGSPELNLDDDDDDDTPETTPAPMGNVSFDFPGNQSFMDVVQMMPRSVPISIASPADLVPSTGSTPSDPLNQVGEDKQISAVDILAQLLSKGRQLQKHSDNNSPVEEVATPTVDEPPKELMQGRPLLSLIDSLFPKLSDSIKTLKEKEQVSDSPPSESPAQSENEAPILAGSPLQDPALGLRPGVPPADAEAPRFSGPRPLHEKGPHVGPIRGEAMGSGHNAPVQGMCVKGPPGDHIPQDPPEKRRNEGPQAPFPEPRINGPPNRHLDDPPQEGSFPRRRPIPGEGRFFDEVRSPFPGLPCQDMPPESPHNWQFGRPAHEGPFPQGRPEQGGFQDKREVLFTGPQNIRPSDCSPGIAPNKLLRGPSHDGPFPQRHLGPGNGPSFQGPPSNGPSGMGLASPPLNGPPFGQMPVFVPEVQQRGPTEDTRFERGGSFPRVPPSEGPPFVAEVQQRGPTEDTRFERGGSFPRGPPSEGQPFVAEVQQRGPTEDTRFERGGSFPRGPPSEGPPFVAEVQQRGPTEDTRFERGGSFPRGPPSEGPPFGRAPPERMSPGALLRMRAPLAKEPERPSNPPHSNHGAPDAPIGLREGPGQDVPRSEPLREGPHGPPGIRRHSFDRGPPRGPDFAAMHHGPLMHRGLFPGPPGGAQFRGSFTPGNIQRRNSQSGQEQQELLKEPPGVPSGNPGPRGPSEKVDYCEDDPSFWTSFEASENASRGPAHLTNTPDNRFRERTFHLDRNSAEHPRPPFAGFMNETMRPRNFAMKRPLPPPPFPPGHIPKRPYC